MKHDMIGDITSFIFMDDEPVQSDLILIPGSKQWEHVEKAASLYHQRLAPKIMVCGKYSYQHGRFESEKIQNPRYQGQFESEAQYYKRILNLNGVPDLDILCEDQSTNTFENAMFAKRILIEKGIQVNKIILCCQAFHARRAYMTFARYFQDASFRVVPAVTQDIRRENWWKREDSFLRVMQELEKCGKFFQDMYPVIQKADIDKSENTLYNN